jgi:uncharacterized caspase-like protein
VWAQSDGAVRLLRLPKQALVIGNSKYAKVPALVNPGNDARGLAEALRASGFTVELLLDATQGEMAAAIAAHARALAEKKCVGLFYFAGHGLQLDWHNYLAPVDAEIARVEDIAARCVNVSALIEGIKRAANPMNVIILDACRENPFASHARIEQKGLSQMDAPSGTLLAYATAPGNLASDGGGAKNGLYTERLLREMRVPEAKIEDVFKRVRLGVRLASRGQQIPWESTSLEEDFYFNPPEQLRKLSREQEERAFAEERDLFEKARASRQAPSLQDYLERYPRGRFAELAQVQLDGLLAAQGERPIEIAPSQGNPLTTGSARADTKFKVGDWYAYHNRDRADVKEWRGRQRVTAISDLEVEFNEGKIVLDLLGNNIRILNGQRFTARQDIPLEFVVGKRWTTRFDIVGGPAGAQGTMELDYRIAAREKITVPAGTFDCFRVEGVGYNRGQAHDPIEVRLTFWRSPEIRRPVAWEEVRTNRGKGRFEDIRHELTAFFQQA